MQCALSQQLYFKLSLCTGNIKVATFPQLVMLRRRQTRGIELSLEHKVSCVKWWGKKVSKTDWKGMSHMLVYYTLYVGDACLPFSLFFSLCLLLWCWDRAVCVTADLKLTKPERCWTPGVLWLQRCTPSLTVMRCWRSNTRLPALQASSPISELHP